MAPTARRRGTSRRARLLRQPASRLSRAVREARRYREPPDRTRQSLTASGDAAAPAAPAAGGRGTAVPPAAAATQRRLAGARVVLLPWPARRGGGKFRTDRPVTVAAAAGPRIPAERGATLRKASGAVRQLWRRMRTAKADCHMTFDLLSNVLLFANGRTTARLNNNLLMPTIS